MKFKHSIVIRFALFFTGLIIFSILLSGYLVFRKASRVIAEYSKERVTHTSELAEQSFYALLNEVSNDIAVIASSPTLQNYVYDHSQKATQDINQLFGIILKNKESYFQIRLIGIENNGKEIIRFDKENGQVMKSEDLQEKGDREYFKEAIKIHKGEFYFSKINLNEEYGVISEPHVPTLRAASPIFDTDDQPMGAVVINVDLSQLYKTLKHISGMDSQLYLIDLDGQYLYSPEKSQEFGSQTNMGHNFYKDFHFEPNSLPTAEGGFGQLKGSRDNTYLGYIKELTYFQGTRKIHLISTIEQNVLLKSARAVRDDSMQTLFWVCLFSMLMSWLFANFFSKKINQVTKAIANYDKGIIDHMNLPINRKDEIGTLAKTFTKMKAKIDRNVHELNDALEKEQQAKKQRDEFLQNMSHEMRTPLNAILGLTKLLYKNSPSELQLPIISSLEKSSNSLAGLVYDVLDHQKLVEGKLNIEYKPTDIAGLLKDIHASYQYEAIQKGLGFHLNLDKKLEEHNFQTDSLRLSQIVINLVVNAIKYTQKGKINLSAKIIGTETQVLEIRLKDTGIGILPENLNKINDRFFREKEDLSGRYGGYGLGLSIVKQLTALFGGTLKAFSEKGTGSEFYVTLPIISTFYKETKDNASSGGHVFPQLHNQYKILHIEDDPSTLELIKYLLDEEHISLSQVNRLDKALESINSIAPDLIVSDLMLEGENLQPALSEWIITKKITCPLLLVSALEPEVMEQISELYFQKPFNIDHLKDHIYQILGSNEFTAPNFSNIYNNYDHNSSKVAKVLELLQEEFETYLRRMDNAAEDKDQNEWEAILHKLIAHINNLKLTPLLDLLPKKIAALKNEDLNKIHNAFAYYLCCFRVENRINLRD